MTIDIWYVLSLHPRQNGGMYSGLELNNVMPPHLLLSIRLTSGLKPPLLALITILTQGLHGSGSLAYATALNNIVSAGMGSTSPLPQTVWNGINRLEWGSVIENELEWKRCPPEDVSLGCSCPARDIEHSVMHSRRDYDLNCKMWLSSSLEAMEITRNFKKMESVSHSRPVMKRGTTRRPMMDNYSVKLSFSGCLVHALSLSLSLSPLLCFYHR